MDPAPPSPIGACGEVSPPAGSPSSGYLGTLGGGDPPEAGRVLSVGVLGCGASKRRTRMTRALETDKEVKWAGASRTIPLLAPMGA